MNIYITRIVRNSHVISMVSQIRVPKVYLLFLTLNRLSDLMNYYSIDVE